jgi:hypothetical protein
MAVTTDEGRTPVTDPLAALFHWPSPERLLEAPPAREYLLTRQDAGFTRGVLPIGKVGILIGAGGVGKTFALSTVALAVATGASLFDTFIVDRPGPVLIGLAEEDEAEIWRRMHAAAASMGLSRDQRIEACSRILPLPLAGHDVALTTSDGRGNIDTTVLHARLRERLERMEVAWSLLILDPLSRWAGNDVEKDNHAATRFIEVAEELTRTRGNPTVILAHHTNKLSRGARARPGGAEEARGVSAITDGARWAANLQAESDDVVVFKVTKNNYAPPTPPLYLVRDRDAGGSLRPMGTDELEEWRSSRERKGGRPASDDAAVDIRILTALAKPTKPGERRSKNWIVEHAAVNRTRGRERVSALLEAGRLVFDGSSYRLPDG